MSEDLHAALPPWPERFNLCEYFLDHNLEAGRAQKPALLCGDQTKTYAELVDRSRRAAAALRRRGVRPEERVLLLLPDGFEFAEAWFGILRAGAVFAMVNPLLKRGDLEHYLAYSKARVVIAHESTLGELAGAVEQARWCEQVLVVGEQTGGFTSWEDALEAEDPTAPEAETEPTGPGDLAGWLFTSGSTGKPKACVHSHADFAWNTEHYALGLVGYEEGDVCLSVPKLFFGYATGTNLMFPFRAGASAVLFPDRSTADVLFDHIERYRPSLLTCVPTMFNNMLASPRCDTVDLSSLRVCLSAGEALPPELYRRWMERTGVEILDGIGSAEMFHIYISNRPGDVVPGSLGRIVPGYEAQVVDPQGEDVPDGEPGRLRVRGGSTALCYWGDREKSRETFQGEWCTTADIFRREEGGLFFYEGRSDDLLKVSGIWVSPLEIENALLSHEAVREVCVVGREDEAGMVKPLAFVVPEAGVAGDEETAATLTAHLKERLAPYKYPRWYEWRDELPKNDRGKIARAQLK
ncbi:MAG: benzoate-CoA ligase family protein [Planctomycetota bacterium]|jgi:benzoate-CoA ligase family protein|nr:benzoate-CoA ligase family protein [Planctomycetota bacterium]MDP6763204.1 benzoate-CoA ligase family protein [Planctomycetota bacterium]MDP6990587.1 benzoate-CoA ligase family protein [Planctomycetota bacterium]